MKNKNIHYDKYRTYIKEIYYDAVYDTFKWILKSEDQITHHGSKF